MIKEFAQKWLEKFRDPNIYYIELVEHYFADDCRVLGFEMDCGHKMELLHEYKEVTMRYKSLMGKAEIEFLTGQDKLHGIDRIMKRDERTCDYEYNKASVEHTAVIRLKVTEYSGKINPVSGNAE